MHRKFEFNLFVHNPVKPNPFFYQGNIWLLYFYKPDTENSQNGISEIFHVTD